MSKRDLGPDDRDDRDDRNDDRQNGDQDPNHNNPDDDRGLPEDMFDDEFIESLGGEDEDAGIDWDEELGDWNDWLNGHDDDGDNIKDILGAPSVDESDLDPEALSRLTQQLEKRLEHSEDLPRKPADEQRPDHESESLAMAMFGSKPEQPDDEDDQENDPLEGKSKLLLIGTDGKPHGNLGLSHDSPIGRFFVNGLNRAITDETLPEADRIRFGAGFVLEFFKMADSAPVRLATAAAAAGFYHGIQSIDDEIINGILPLIKSQTAQIRDEYTLPPEENPLNMMISEVIGTLAEHKAREVQLNRLTDQKTKIDIGELSIKVGEKSEEALKEAAEAVAKYRDGSFPVVPLIINLAAHLQYSEPDEIYDVAKRLGQALPIGTLASTVRDIDSKITPESLAIFRDELAGLLTPIALRDLMRNGLSAMKARYAYAAEHGTFEGTADLKEVRSFEQGLTAVKGSVSFAAKAAGFSEGVEALIGTAKNAVRTAEQITRHPKVENRL